MATLAQGSIATLTLAATDSILIDSGPLGLARIEAVSLAGGSGAQVLATHPGGQATYGPFGTGTVKLVSIGGALSYMQGTAPLNDRGGPAYFNSGSTGLVDQDDAVFALSEVTAYVTRTTTGTAHTGAGEFAGYICTVAAGNITAYDNTSAAGTVIVPTTALVVGAFPIFGAGTNGKLALTTGCHVVLSGAATVNVLVQ
jgi:hypothetical protein